MFNPQPIGREKIEAFQRMTPEEKRALFEKIDEEFWAEMMSGTPEEVDRRFEEMNRERDLGNENILRAFARLKNTEDAARQEETS